MQTTMELKMVKIALPKTSWKALKTCMSKDKTRQALNYLHIRNEGAETTDGKMLMRANFQHEYETGVYRIIAEEKGYVTILTAEKMELEYPNTDQVTPVKSKETYSIGIEDNEQGYSYALIKLWHKFKTAISVEFLSRLAGIESRWEVTSVPKVGTPLRFDYRDDFTAVIMPLNTDTITA